MKGPIAKYPYKANCKKAIGMVAGGTGITPMLQVIEEVLRNPADKTKLKLMYANVTEADIILRDRLDALAAKHPDRFSIYYVVDTASGVDQAWKGGLGRISAAMLKAQLPPPSDDNIIFVCGPPGMMAAISGDKAPDKSQGELSGALKDLGYSASQVYKF